jgi:UDP-4-amino-4,6-dideoxy-N-acetyl-beta-L-altrosamine transaminase
LKSMAVIPYSRQNIDEVDIEAVTAVMRSSFLTQGPIVPKFEARFAERHGGGEGVAVANATAALHIACLALGLGSGDRLWTTPISFVASANCARYCGASVDFVDIDPVTRNMSVEALEAKLIRAKAAGELPKIVVPVDFSGLPSDMPAIRQLANQYNFKIIEDASHAAGAALSGVPVGANLADITVFSFHAVKVITTAEGGLCLTQNPDVARALMLLRSHGITRDPKAMSSDLEGPWVYEQIGLGFNYRMTELQAALGLSQLDRLDSFWQAREALSQRYDRLLQDLPLKTPVRLNDRQSSHHLYVVEIDPSRTHVTRASVFASLQAADISVNVHYIPIHLQPYYRTLGFKRGDFPASETYYDRALSLPLFPTLTEKEQDYIVNALRAALSF